MINNLEIIRHLLTFESEDDFYFLQIVLRRKEVPTLKKNSYIIKSYYITSVEHLERLMELEIIPICNALNARAYINLGLRSFERNALESLRKVTQNLINKNYEAVKAVYDSACGFLWSYDKLIKHEGSFGQNTICVIQCDINGNSLKEWSSICLAAKELKLSKSGIIKCCKGKQKQCGGFTFKYKTNELQTT